MSTRRELLIGKFRAGALDRIRKVCGALIEIRQGRGTEVRLEGRARNSHAERRIENARIRQYQRSLPRDRRSLAARARARASTVFPNL